MKTTMPDAAKLTDEEVDATWGDNPNHVPQDLLDQMNDLVRPSSRVLADAAAEKAWHARDAEVVELQKQLDAAMGSFVNLRSYADKLVAERDVALEQVRALVGSIEYAVEHRWASYTMQWMETAVAATKEVDHDNDVAV